MQIIFIIILLFKDFWRLQYTVSHSHPMTRRIPLAAAPLAAQSASLWVRPKDQASAHKHGHRFVAEKRNRSVALHHGRALSCLTTYNLPLEGGLLGVPAGCCFSPAYLTPMASTRPVLGADRTVITPPVPASPAGGLVVSWGVSHVQPRASFNQARLA